MINYSHPKPQAGVRSEICFDVTTPTINGYKWRVIRAVFPKDQPQETKGLVAYRSKSGEKCLTSFAYFSLDDSDQEVVDTAYQFMQEILTK